MIISKLNLYIFEAPFKQPIKTVKVTMKSRKVLIIGLVIDGKEYFSECNAFETDWYHHETIETVIKDVKIIFDRLMGKAIHQIEDIKDFLLPNSPNANACIDVCVYQAFHSQASVQIPIGQTLNIGQSNIIPNAKRIKLKMHSNVLSQVENIRKVSNIPIVIDANGTLDQNHFSLLNTISKYDILYFEEPFSKIQDYHKCHQKYPNIKLAIDESATSIEAINRFEESISYAVIKYSRIGNVSQLLKQQLPIQCVAGGMYEFQLSKYFTAKLGAHFNTVPDVTPSGTYFTEDYAKFTEMINDEMTLSFPNVQKERLKLIFEQ